MLTLVQEYAVDFFGLFYPNICCACSKNLLKGESVVCLRCETDLPLAEYSNKSDNPLMKRFWGRVDLQGASAMYVFHKGSQVQHLLHQLKYRGRKDIGEYIGRSFANKLVEVDSVIKGVDLIVPVPLHWKKLKKRGYNQCDSFAKGLSETMGIPWSSTAIERIQENISQTKKKRIDRWENVAEIFSVKDETQLKGQHILLVDDVVTTGATAEACLNTILKVESTKVSFAAIAHARY